MRHIHTRLLLLVVVGLSAPACIIGGGLGQVQNDALTADQAPNANVTVERSSMVVGTVFDFRAVRAVSSLEMVSKKPTAEVPGDRVPQVDDTYEERRLVRLDVPALALWDFDNGGLGYPGIMEHRHSLDLWGRGGVVAEQGDPQTFAGGALTYYNHGSIAASFTVDYWMEPTEFRAIEGSGAFDDYVGRTGGWVVGVELTVAAGEYALDIFSELFEMDKTIREKTRRMADILQGRKPAASW